MAHILSGYTDEKQHQFNANVTPIWDRLTKVFADGRFNGPGPHKIDPEVIWVFEVAMGLELDTTLSYTLTEVDQ
jgi:hypothetical protein